MRRYLVSLAAVVSLTVVLVSGCARAPEYPIKYIVENRDTIVNKHIAVNGVVEQPQLVEYNPFTKVRGQYVLRDENGDTITVFTTTNPPPTGSFKHLIAVVDAKSTPISLVEQSTLMLQSSDVLLYSLLAILCVIAVILIVLLARSSSKARKKIEKDVEKAHIAQTPEKYCPTCQKVYAVDANYCEECAVKLQTRTKKDGRTVVIQRERDRTRELPVTAQTSAAYLEVIDAAGNTGQRFPLDMNRLTIGYAVTNDIHLEDDSVSRSHAEIHFDGNQYVIRDLESTNGTLVNGRRVTQHVLSENDGIQLGQTQLRFHTGVRAGVTFDNS